MNQPRRTLHFVPRYAHLISASKPERRALVLSHGKRSYPALTFAARIVRSIAQGLSKAMSVILSVPLSAQGDVENNAFRDDDRDDDDEQAGECPGHSEVTSCTNVAAIR